MLKLFIEISPQGRDDKIRKYSKIEGANQDVIPTRLAKAAAKRAAAIAEWRNLK